MSKKGEKVEESEWKIKDDCFAYRVNGRGKGECDCLDDLYCAQKECKFYKSKEEYKRIRAESLKFKMGSN